MVKTSFQFILYLSFFFKIILLKISLPESVLNSSLNKCRRCKLVTDSFNYWLENTSRGKFEGGDAAWEESKLKSYSRSEVRLVEIQENLCSELKKNQGQCYSLIEEVEQELEMWWFQEEPNTVDLYTWLCLDTVKLCCPKNHYGATCKPCPRNKNDITCGQHGICDGDGTRSGNGTCTCQSGYTGDLCEKCSSSHYKVEEGTCEPCHRACDGCSAEGVAACDACNLGWMMDNGVCIDIDECSHPASCQPHQYCINREGSHTCKECYRSCKTCVGPGPSDCKSCRDRHIYWSGMCVSEKHNNILIVDIVKRVALYLGLLTVTYFVLRFSRSLSAVTVVVIAIYIFFSEKTAKMNVLDVILMNILHSNEN